MKMIGTGKAKLHGPEEEFPHSPGSNEYWQESVVLHWFDAKAGIGGYFRIGHEPHLGNEVLWCSYFTTKGDVFNHNAKFPLREKDRLPNGFAAGDCCRYEVIDGKIVWTSNEDSVQARLVADDFHTPIDLYPSDSGTLSDDYCKDHLEVASHVSGEVIFDGRRYKIDGFGYRDHSWGERRWRTLLSHRWVTGVLGADCSFGAMSWHAEDNTLNIWGYLIRGYAVHYAKYADIVTFTEQDALTHRGGIVYMTLPDDEKIEIYCTTIAPGAISDNQGMYCNDTICIARCGDLVGYCDFETSVNPTRGDRAPTLAVNAYLENGLFRSGTVG